MPVTGDLFTWDATADGTPADPKGVWTAPVAGPSPAGTVTSETAFGQASNAGAAATYSRGDHTHGTPTNPVTGHESTYAHANLPTADEKAALAGTSGAPSVTNKYVTDADARNTDARTPTAHTHANADLTGASDTPAIDTIPISGHVSGKLAVGFLPTGSTANDVCVGNDARLSDARTPTAHNHAASEITSGTLDGDRLPATSTTKRGGVPATGTPSGKYLEDDGSWSDPPGDLLVDEKAELLATTTTVPYFTFDASGEKVTGSNPLAGDTAFTIAVWAYGDADDGNNHALLDVGACLATDVLILQYGGTGRLRVFLNGAVNAYDPAVFGGTGWHRVLVSHPGGANPLNLYVDGVWKAASAAANPAFAGADVCIGNETGAHNWYPWEGGAAEVKIWSRELTQQEIADDYNDKTVSAVNLDRRWPLASQAGGNTPEVIVPTSDPYSGATLTSGTVPWNGYVSTSTPAGAPRPTMDDQTLVSDRSVASGLAWVNRPVITKVLHTDATSAVTTWGYVSLTDLLFYLVANQRYSFRVVAMVRSAATTTGIGLSVAGSPTTVGTLAYRTCLPDVSGGVYAETVSQSQADDSGTVGSGVVAATTSYIATIEGVIVPRQNQYFTLRFKSEVNASTVTVQSGSIMQVWQE